MKLSIAVRVLGAAVITLSAGVSSAVGQDSVRSGVPSGVLTRDEVLRAAMSHSPLVDAAAARLSASRGSRRTAGALPNPVLSYQVENTAFPGQDLPAELERETSIFATLPLEPLYQRGPQVRRADQEVRAAGAALVVQPIAGSGRCNARRRLDPRRG